METDGSLGRWNSYNSGSVPGAQLCNLFSDTNGDTIRRNIAIAHSDSIVFEHIPRGETAAR